MSLGICLVPKILAREACIPKSWKPGCPHLDVCTPKPPGSQSNPTPLTCRKDNQRQFSFFSESGGKTNRAAHVCLLVCFPLINTHAEISNDDHGFQDKLALHSVSWLELFILKWDPVFFPRGSLYFLSWMIILSWTIYILTLLTGEWPLWRSALLKWH